MKKIMKKKNLFFIFFISLFFMVDVVSAKTYDVELVNSADEINNGSADNYLMIVSSGGISYAWVNGAFDDSGKNSSQKKANAVEVTVNENLTQITIDDEFAPQALWTFGITKNSVKTSSSAYALIASNDLYTGDNSNKNQVDFSFTTKSDKSNPTGFVYSSNAYPITLKYSADNNGNTKIMQDNNGKDYYVQFSSSAKNFYVSNKEESSKTFNIYKVIEKNDVIDGFDVTEKGKLNFSKKQTAHKSFEKTGVYQIDLALSAKSINKDIDIVFVLDYSNSMDTEAKINALTRSTSSLAEQILTANPKNRVGIIKFANVALMTESTFNLGLSSDINAIKDFLAEDVGTIPGGTNYTDAFKVTNELLSQNYVPNRDQVVIFITDGAPTIYNKIKYTVFNDTDDNKVGAYADNWSNFIMNYDLAPVRTLKQKGIEIITVGVGTDEDIPITSSGSFVMKPEVTQGLLKKLASNENDAYFVNTYEQLYDYLKDKFVLDLYLHNTIVHDFVNENYKLVIDEFDGNLPYVEIKMSNGDVIERIDFNNDGTVAYNNFSEDINILFEENGHKVLKGVFFDYDFETKKINWNIDHLVDNEIMLTYFIEPEKVQDSYKKDDGAIDGEVKVNYKDYDNTDVEVSYLFESEEKVENPPTGSVSLWLDTSIVVFMMILLGLLLRKFAHNK